MFNENLIVLKEKGVDISKIDFKDYLFDSDRENLYKWMKYATNDSLSVTDRVLKNNVVLERLGWNEVEYIDCIFPLRLLFGKFKAYFTTGTPYREYTLKETFDSYDKIFCDEEKIDFVKCMELTENSLMTCLKKLINLQKYKYNWKLYALS